MLLRLFGAKMGPRCHFYPSSRLWAPWNLICADQITVGDGAEIYNPAPIRLGSQAILSQNSYLCVATHDFDDPGFLLLAYAMEVGPYVWVCARACVAPGINVGALAGIRGDARPGAMERLRRCARGQGEATQPRHLVATATDNKTRRYSGSTGNTELLYEIIAAARKAQPAACSRGCPALPG